MTNRFNKHDFIAIQAKLDIFWQLFDNFVTTFLTCLNAASRKIYFERSQSKKSTYRNMSNRLFFIDCLQDNSIRSIKVFSHKKKKRSFISWMIIFSVYLMNIHFISLGKNATTIRQFYQLVTTIGKFLPTVDSFTWRGKYKFCLKNFFNII